MSTNRKIIIDDIEYELKPVIRRPPLGIEPEWLVKERRLNDINNAIARYVVSNFYYPIEWLVEKKELEDWIEKRKIQCIVP